MGDRDINIDRALLEFYFDRQVEERTAKDVQELVGVIYGALKRVIGTRILRLRRGEALTDEEMDWFDRCTTGPLYEIDTQRKRLESFGYFTVGDEEIAFVRRHLDILLGIQPKVSTHT